MEDLIEHYKEIQLHERNYTSHKHDKILSINDFENYIDIADYDNSLNYLEDLIDSFPLDYLKYI